jgi:uncharacterized membrane protein YkvA (DUF1232 family)
MFKDEAESKRSLSENEDVEIPDVESKVNDFEAEFNDPKSFEEQEELVKQSFWSKTKKVAAKVPFVLDAVTMYYCSIDQKTPLWAKGVAFGALAYFINPADVVPDAIPIAGFTDDAGVVVAALSALGKNVTDEHKNEASKTMLGKEFQS